MGRRASWLFAGAEELAFIRGADDADQGPRCGCHQALAFRFLEADDVRCRAVAEDNTDGARPSHSLAAAAAAVTAEDLDQFGLGFAKPG